MVDQLHILLTYNCSLKCKHCYVYSNQKATGKISFSQIANLLKAGRRIEGLEWVYFGGGEPFTQYPLLLQAIHRARQLDYRVGVETNGYFARTEKAALRMLRPLALMDVEDLRVSNDELHYRKPGSSPAKKALDAARELGIPTTLVQISPPGIGDSTAASPPDADRIDQPRFMYSGRAATFFAEQAAGIGAEGLAHCPRADLAKPSSLFVDAFGYVQICPGIAIGNTFQAPLEQIINNYDVSTHEILHHIQDAGPAGLIEELDLPPVSKIADTCHGCYITRKALIDKYPHILGPRQVYGLA